MMKLSAVERYRPGPRTPVWRRAFTLVEIMVVVAVIGIVLAAGVPSLFKLLRKEGFRKTMGEVEDVFKAARSRAILQGVPTQVVFHPREGRCEVVGGKADGNSGGLATSAQIGPKTHIDGLFVDLADCTREEEIAVNFHPEGTCDELILILRSDRNEQRGFMLEITTGLVLVLSEADLQKLEKGKL